MSAERRAGPAGPVRQAAATNAVARRRLGGYAAAVRAAGLSWEDVAVDEVAENVPEQGADSARRLLATRPRPTAVLAMSDRLAAGVLSAAAEVGLDVPGELSVVGHDDVPLAATTYPPLTTVHQPRGDKGRQAGETLRALLDGREVTPVQLPATLVVRAATVAPHRA